MGLVNWFERVEGGREGRSFWVGEEEGILTRRNRDRKIVIGWDC